jgi:glycosyltransferase involved in cell wall biosynthesis
LKVRLAATHPIQYQAPWFRALAERREVELEVGFAWLPDRHAQGVGFGVPFEWDVPLLEGYRWTELERAGRHPDLERFGSLRIRGPGRWLPWEVGALIVTGWHRLPLVQLALAARRRGIPVLARGDSSSGRQRSLPRRLILRAWLRLFSAFLVVGASNRLFYRELGIPESRLFACPHFIDNERFAAGAERSPSGREEVRGRWGASSGDVVALFCGKLIPEKNVEELLDAFHLAAASEPRLRLVLVGDGPSRSSLEARAGALGPKVRWDGFRNQSELPELYAAADLFVLPSRSETWGLVVNEAFASGLPVIASDRVGCVPDLVIPGRTGEVYPSGSAGSLTDRLLRLAANPELRRREGRAGRELVFEKYSVGAAVEGTLAALAAVAGAAA